MPEILRLKLLPHKSRHADVWRTPPSQSAANRVIIVACANRVIVLTCANRVIVLAFANREIVLACAEAIPRVFLTRLDVVAF